MNNNLTGLPNIGKVVSMQLNEIGVFSENDLKKIGAREAWLKILSNDSSACYNRLLGLEGAIRGIKKTELPEFIKKELKDFYIQQKKW